MGDRAVGENIYGPFEAGFSSAQEDILAGLGCATGKGYLDGGIDTGTSTSIVARDCIGETGSLTSGLVDSCGGHTSEYHFHESLSCCTAIDGSDGHSGQVGKALDGRYLYGKNEMTGSLPNLDACGGHWGTTPDGYSYHYHVQEKAPFTIGCYGPNDDNSVVTLAQCRALYSGCTATPNTYSVQTGSTWPTTADGTVSYALWCPCYDAAGSNVGTSALPCEADAAAPGCTKMGAETGVTLTGYTATTSGGAMGGGGTSGGSGGSGSGSGKSGGSGSGGSSNGGSGSGKSGSAGSGSGGSGSGKSGSAGSQGSGANSGSANKPTRATDDAGATTAEVTPIKTAGASTLLPSMVALALLASAIQLLL
jgi:hypothetical protein